MDQWPWDTVGPGLLLDIPGREALETSALTKKGAGKFVW